MQYGVGLEGVDVEAATKAGVVVSNIPATTTGNAIATAEHGIFLCLALLRHLNDLPRRFDTEQCLGGLPIPQTLFGKRVTVVGYGAVGSVLCQYLQALGANVTAVRRTSWASSPPPEGIAGDISSHLHNNNILPTTDVLILACPLMPETKYLVNDTSVERLPAHALVVNIGRGPLVEYHAMLNALKAGDLGGYASDVGVGHPMKPSEPWDPLDELSQHPLTVFTPHIGGYSDHSYTKMAVALVDAIECIQQGTSPPVWMNRPGIT
jgi:phosphoglycerate dehydrogenase-like enzyme